MGSYEYDTKSWIQRIPYVFMSLLYIAILVLVIRQQFKIRKTVNLKYGRYALILYFVAITFTALLRILYFYSGDEAIPTPSALYAISAFSPSLLMIVASILFLNYLLNSLQSRFESIRIKRYAVLEMITKVFLAIMFPIQVFLFACSVYQEYHDDAMKSFEFEKIYHGINNGLYFVVSIFLVYIIKCYNDELKVIVVAFYNRRKAIILVIMTTFIQIIIRIVNAILIILGEYVKLEKKTYAENFPYAQLCYLMYLILSDVLLILAYTYYVEKDTKDLVVFEVTETQSPSYRPSKESFIGEDY